MTLRGLDRHLCLLIQLRELIHGYQPTLIAYEEYTWRSNAREERYLHGRSDMERLIGGIQGFAIQPPYPVLLGLLPQKWGEQLVGQRSHTKQQVAWAVNARLGTVFQGNHGDNHTVDSVGVALVAMDMMQQLDYYTQHEVKKGDNSSSSPAL